MRLKNRRGNARGQVIVIAALLSLVLFAILGLAIDAGLSYLSANGAERAAAAGALAGVPYMPAGFGSTADSAAKLASGRNGFTDGDTSGGRNVTVTVSQYPAGCGLSPAPACDPHRLTVSVGVTVGSTFMQLVGFSTHRVVATDTALYLPPIALGQPGGQLGSDLNSLGDPAQGGYYIMRSEGWGTDRSQGDGLTPDFRQSPGVACDQGASYGTTTDVHQISENRSTEVTNAVLTGPGYNFSAVPKRGGYNYLITVPAGVSGVHVQVYNPSFAPDNGYTTVRPGTSYNMHEQDSSFDTSNYGDQTQYSVMEYTLFKVVNNFDHTQDTPLSQMIFNPIDASNASSGGPFYDRRTGQKITAGANNVYHAWVDVVGTGLPGTTEAGGGALVSAKGIASTSLGAGLYRLRVDHLDWQGKVPYDDGSASMCSRAHKGYATRLLGPGGTTASCTTGGPTPTPCTLSGLEDLGLYTPFQGGGSFDIPIFYVPTDYAGLTINVLIFDPGDVGGAGTASMSIVDPTTNNPVTSPNGIGIYDLGVDRSTPPTTTVNSASPGSQPNPDTATVTTYSGGSVLWNSHWVLFEIPIPPSYTTASYWNLRYTIANNITATDTITLAVGFNGVAVHLLP